ncbi:SAV_2336 N-terminal domain-related protein [Streptomyces sp. NPDC090025]|uniref:SAV_2336 N-terminal domain-related protein n=1 Tax=Streptomyces sp. NPDC090025 TaxID=3365922 RepID=UPI0038369EAE
MHELHLEELTRRLRAGGQDPTAEEVADAVWLAQWLPRADPAPARGAPGQDGAAVPVRAPGAPHAPEDRPDPANSPPGPADPPTTTDPTDPTGPTGPTVTSGRPGETVDLHLTPGGGGPPGGPGGPTALRAGSGAVLPVRAPGANALPGLLGLQKALRPLRHYPAGLPARPGEVRLDEEATAEHSAASGILTPVLRPAAVQRPDIQLLMDTGPAMVVWTRMVEELRQACQQSGAFRDVRVHRLYDSGEGPPLVTATTDADGRPRLRPGDQLHDPTGRRLTLIVSDCVGPLWRRGAAQRLIHQWPRHSPLALVQPLPPRLWPRTALSVEPGTLLRSAGPGGQVRFEPDEPAWEPAAADVRAVPVLTPTPEAFASWARLLTGHGGGTVHGWAAAVGPPAAPDTSAAPRAPGTPARRPGDDELLRAFRAGASAGAVRLAVHLAAAPLALPVMQLVQRAMVPDTGPMELAEVLLSGLLRQLPGPTPYPCFSYPAAVQQHLLGSLDRGAAALVLKHCSEFVERHFGQGMRNFPALAAARLAGQDGETDTVEGPGGSPGPGEDDEYAAGVASELFARIPARVLRFYQPDLVTPEPLDAARRLFDRWRDQSDPALLDTARALVEPLLTGASGEPPDRPEGLAVARLLLGRVLYAQAGTAAVRDRGERRELLERAVAELTLAAGLAPPGGPDRADARLELAAAQHALWRQTGEPGRLDAALAALTDDPRTAAGSGSGAAADGDAAWPESHRHARRVRRGRLLLARGDGAAAAEEFTAALALRATAPVLLDLADARHLAAAPAASVADALDRAAPLLGESDALRLRWTTARARLYESTGDGPAADEAYESATLLTPADGEQRGRILLTWGESLLRRAATGTGSAPVDRAESVLREALTCLPADSAARARAVVLIGSVLALRFDRVGFLPDLFESRHLLEQAVRAAREPAARAEVWLQLGWVRVRLSESGRDGRLTDALAAYRSAADDARRSCGEHPGTVTLARALHGQGAVLLLLDRPAGAKAVLQAAAEQWRRLDGALVAVDWPDVDRTRVLLAELADPARPVADRNTAEGRGRIAPPWWAWRDSPS